VGWFRGQDGGRRRISTERSFRTLGRSLHKDSSELSFSFEKGPIVTRTEREMPTDTSSLVNVSVVRSTRAVPEKVQMHRARANLPNNNKKTQINSTTQGVNEKEDCIHCMTHLSHAPISIAPFLVSHSVLLSLLGNVPWRARRQKKRRVFHMQWQQKPRPKRVFEEKKQI